MSWTGTQDAGWPLCTCSLAVPTISSSSIISVVMCSIIYFITLARKIGISISRKFFIGFCIQDQPFSSYAWSGVPEPVSHSLYSFIHISHILLSLKLSAEHLSAVGKNIGAVDDEGFICAQIIYNICDLIRSRRTAQRSEIYF